MMDDKTIYIDFDGVIVDSQKKIDYFFSLFGNKITAEWNNFLANLNWKVDVLSECKEINNSLTILKELYKMKRDVYILSRVFSLNEAKDKIEYLRDNGVYTDFITSPGRIEKTNVIIPNQNKILIDDSSSNIRNWIDNNGKGIYFTDNIADLVVSKNIFFNKDEEYWQDKDGKYYFKDCQDNLGFLLQKKL